MTRETIGALSSRRNIVEQYILNSPNFAAAPSIAILHSKSTSFGVQPQCTIQLHITGNQSDDLIVSYAVGSGMHNSDLSDQLGKQEEILRQVKLDNLILPVCGSTSAIS